MYYISAITPSGEVAQVTSSQQESSLDFCRVVGLFNIEQQPPTNKSYWDFSVDEWREPAEQPSPHHAFNYTTKQWEDPRTTETEWAVVRSKRARLLLACDWTQLPDVPPTTQGAWASYRQALRDITQQADPFNIVWPAAL